jgi:hypothetical protein
MKPKLLKVSGHPIEAKLKACDTYENLDEVIKLFNKNKNLDFCYYVHGGDCGINDSCASLVTAERMGPLGCGCQQQPKEVAHL